MNPRYSICLTSRNGGRRIEKSLQSILRQIDSTFEVIVVDSFSTDASAIVLNDLEKKGCIRLVRQSCTRGRGRQLAFESSRGEYVIDGMDIEDAYGPVLNSVIKFYHARFEGLVMLLHGFLIAPRAVVAEIGGWRDVQWGEDADFWARAARLGKLRWLAYEPRTDVRPQGSGNLTQKIRYRYEMMRDSFRLGRDPRDKVPAELIARIGYIPLVIMGYLRAKTMQSFSDSSLKSFKRSDHSVPADSLFKWVESANSSYDPSKDVCRASE